MIKPAAGYRPLAYSSPKAVQTTGTVAEARAAYRDEFVCGIFLNKIIIPQNFSAVMTVFDLDTPALKWLKI